MEFLFDGSLSGLTLCLLVGALVLALSFEFVNGFHDTANAVATVIYTHSLKPYQAVIWSGLWNFLGVLTSTGAVAFGIVALLPVELIVNVGSGAGFAMVFALLLSAIIWNVGTWYFGLPASSSHTLIGSIVGVGLMNSYLSSTAKFGEGVNWAKVSDTATALVVSPIIGFVAAGLLLLLAKLLIKNPALYQSPEGNTPPPLWIRSLLVLTCTGVSFAHGSNDGQKGMGLIMLILIGIVPSVYALNLASDAEAVSRLSATSHASLAILDRQPGARNFTMDAKASQDALSAYLRSGTVADNTLAALDAKSHQIDAALVNIKSLNDIPQDSRREVRSSIYLVSESLNKLLKGAAFGGDDKQVLGAFKDQLKGATMFIPTWVKALVALALGLGTMIGWKRIVVTVGEKIGKAHLSYAQGASAELVTMATISAADALGLPVSTTHILSSGIAGTMVANKSGLQKDTVRNIVLAWVLTLPVCVFLGASLFAAGLFVVFRLLGMQ
ncbi:MAG: inorganic phosphate transporter [Rudaea sp.]|nr:inorganic phosphate transporter [Rudaea sp.]